MAVLEPGVRFRLRFVTRMRRGGQSVMKTTKQLLTLYAYALANGWAYTERFLRASWTALERQ